MIFLTIGTHEPFDRLVEAVDAWRARRTRPVEVYGQITSRAGYKPTSFAWTDSLGPADYRAKCQEADLIVSHAGMGSIITALTFGKPILILPRRGHLNETRNDHQYATAARFKGRAGIRVAMDETELPAVLERMLENAGGASGDGEGLGPYADSGLLAAVKALIQDGV